MTTDNPSPFMPKLRFPEFRDDPTWSAPQFTDLYGFKRTNTLPRDKLNYETGTIRNIHYGDIHTKFKPLFRVGDEYVPYINPDASANGFDDDAFCEEGDIVLADASEDLDDVGKAIEVVSLDGERVVAGTHTILATRRGSVPVIGFGGQLFQTAAVRTGIKKEAQGAKVYGISAKRISAVPVPIPPTVTEQQKIAECLGSLDDLIVAEGRKLDALRQHKQGLMQDSFPSPVKPFPGCDFRSFETTQPGRLRNSLTCMASSAPTHCRETNSTTKPERSGIFTTATFTPSSSLCSEWVTSMCRISIQMPQLTDFMMTLSVRKATSYLPTRLKISTTSEKQSKLFH